MAKDAPTALEDLHRYISPAEEVIEEARQGRMYILVDAEDRENEGDLVIPAQFATPDAVNFMAKYGRGLICLAMTGERAAKLHLAPMSPRNQTRHQTAFTVSIEAREGISTGISAHDRAHTVAVAIDPTKDSHDIVTPGHVFPLVARDGGVLMRAGHTEASVDIARLAGLLPASVICEVMNDDGSMARLPELIAFAQFHNLKIGTISDLIAHRRRTEFLVERVTERPFNSTYGDDFKFYIYRNKVDGVESTALVRGVIDPEKPTLVRMHRLEIASDIFGGPPERAGLIDLAMKEIASAPGAAVMVILRDPSPDAPSRRLAEAEGEAIGPDPMLREIGVGAQVLRDLGVGHMIVLTSTPPRRLVALEGYGLIVDGWRIVSANKDEK
jgi:3,4-dihydroxy 2-butanone 4-phosphate synthase/GTP cyclohydrolase II